jgi:hypothetical protein
MNCKKISLVIISFVFSISTFSQKNTVKVIDIKGFSIINDRITPKQAKEEALLDAQRNALKSAGIEERLQSNMLLLKSSNNDTNFEFFSKEVQTQIEGSILDYEIKSTEISSDLKVVVVINATIIKYDTKPDLNFDIKLAGVKSVYNNNDTLNFSVVTSIDCYMYFFSYIEDTAMLIYPNTTELEQSLTKGIIYTYPHPQKLKYQLTAYHKKNEKGRLIYVFTKKPMKYFQMDASQVTTPENIYTWINSIPLDQKKVITKPILIQY